MTRDPSGEFHSGEPYQQGPIMLTWLVNYVLSSEQIKSHVRKGLAGICAFGIGRGWFTLSPSDAGDFVNTLTIILTGIASVVWSSLSHSPVGISKAMDAIPEVKSVAVSTSTDTGKAIVAATSDKTVSMGQTYTANGR